MAFGEKIQRLRRERGLSQDQLAEMLNVSRQAVSKWERDEAVPETEKVLRISELFSVSIDSLLKDQPQPEQESPPPQSDFSTKAGRLFRTKGYYLGYVLLAWGVLDLVRFLLVRAAWSSMSGFVDSLGTAGADIQNAMQAPLTVLWSAVLLAILKITGGILVVVLGKRYCKSREGKS